MVENKSKLFYQEIGSGESRTNGQRQQDKLVALHEQLLQTFITNILFKNLPSKISLYSLLWTSKWTTVYRFSQNNYNIVTYRHLLVKLKILGKNILEIRKNHFTLYVITCKLPSARVILHNSSKKGLITHTVKKIPELANTLISATTTRQQNFSIT